MRERAPKRVRVGVHAPRTLPITEKRWEPTTRSPNAPTAPTPNPVLQLRVCANHRINAGFAGCVIRAKVTHGRMRARRPVNEPRPFPIRLLTDFFDNDKPTWLLTQKRPRCGLWRRATKLRARWTTNWTKRSGKRPEPSETNWTAFTAARIHRACRLVTRSPDSNCVRRRRFIGMGAWRTRRGTNIRVRDIRVRCPARVRLGFSTAANRAYCGGKRASMWLLNDECRPIHCAENFTNSHGVVRVSPPRPRARIKLRPERTICHITNAYHTHVVRSVMSAPPDPTVAKAMYATNAPVTTPKTAAATSPFGTLAYWTL